MSLMLLAYSTPFINENGMIGNDYLFYGDVQLMYCNSIHVNRVLSA